jgi:hypothetical protein
MTRGIGRRSRRLALFSGCLMIALSSMVPVATSPAGASSPPLTVPTATLDQALQCTSNLAGASRPPILLVPGTATTPQDTFAWNYERAFDELSWPWCSVTLPDSALGDATVSAQYVVWAIRVMRWVSRQPVDIVGYSQGGMLPRWALKYWPETRGFVQAMIALDPSNHGSVDANAVCSLACPAGIWQQEVGSPFLDALNNGPQTWPGINYTVIYSATDEIVPQAFNPSALPPAPNVVNVKVQDLCPLDLSEHLAMGTYDAVGYALVMDALTHGGLAAPDRISPLVCDSLFAPDVDPASLLSNFGVLVASLGIAFATAPQLTSPPPLPAYAS